MKKKIVQSESLRPNNGNPSGIRSRQTIENFMWKLQNNSNDGARNDCTFQ